MTFENVTKSGQQHAVIYLVKYLCELEPLNIKNLAFNITHESNQQTFVLSTCVVSHDHHL